MPDCQMTNTQILRRVIRELRGSSSLGQLNTAHQYGRLFVRKLIRDLMSKKQDLTGARETYRYVANVYTAEKERLQ